MSFSLVAQDSSQSMIQLMSYNIWYDNPQNIENGWTDRIKVILSTIDSLNPDIFCVQEALVHQVLDLKKPGYTYRGVGRDDGNSSGEFAAIYYKDSRFSVRDGGSFWLSEHPDSVGSVGWDAVLPRIVTWVKLNEASIDQNLFIFNTHFSHVGEKARLESVELILRKINEIAGDEPFVLCGDFNFTKHSEPYQVLIGDPEGHKLSDSRYRVTQADKDPGFSFVGSDFKGEKGDIIDHVFVSGEIQVYNNQILNNCKNGKCPSDHLPVVVLFSIIK